MLQSKKSIFLPFKIRETPFVKKYILVKHIQQFNTLLPFHVLLTIC